MLSSIPLSAQIVVPPDAQSAAASGCVGVDFGCGPCIQKWFASPEMSLLEGQIFGTEANCNTPPENFEVSPNSYTNLIVRFTDRDRWKLKGNCNPDNNLWNYVTEPSHTIIFKILETTNMASFTPYGSSMPTTDSIATQATIISQNESLTVLGNQAIPIYFAPDSIAVSNDTINVSVTILDNEVPLTYQPPAVGATGTRVDAPLEDIYTYTFVINSQNFPTTMRKSNVHSTPNDNEWTFMDLGQECYNYEVLDTCPPSNPIPSFDNQLITEELFSGNVLFSINDLNPMWLSNNSIDPEDAMALEMAADIMFPMGYFNNEASWVICSNNIEDCHGFMTHQDGLNLNLTQNDALEIFKASAINNNRAGYSLQQRFKAGSGGIIGTATINRIIARKSHPNPLEQPRWGFYIKKQHDICNE